MSTARLEPPVTPPPTPEIIVLKLGDREYELVPFLKAGETSVDGDEMVRRAEQLNANLGEDDGRFILANQADIPAELRRKITLVFTAWRHPDLPRVVSYSSWGGKQWVRNWGFRGKQWYSNVRLVRRRV